MGCFKMRFSRCEDVSYSVFPFVFAQCFYMIKSLLFAILAVLRMTFVSCGNDKAVVEKFNDLIDGNSGLISSLINLKVILSDEEAESLVSLSSSKLVTDLSQRRSTPQEEYKEFVKSILDKIFLVSERVGKTRVRKVEEAVGAFVKEADVFLSYIASIKSDNLRSESDDPSSKTGKSLVESSKNQFHENNLRGSMGTKPKSDLFESLPGISYTSNGSDDEDESDEVEETAHRDATIVPSIVVPGGGGYRTRKPSSNAVSFDKSTPFLYLHNPVLLTTTHDFA
jgi:hypothetical protein